MLLLLEGHIVHFAAPKTTYNQDIDFSNDTPIFATSKAPLSFVKGSMTDNRETEMMAVRWRTFTFRHHFDISEFPIDDATTRGMVARPGTSPAAPSCFQGQIVGSD